MARTAWTLTDNSTGSPVVLTFTINPYSASYPEGQANLTTDTTTAINGQPIVFSGQDALSVITVDMKVISQAWYESLVTWSQKRNPMTLTDDLGNTWTVLIRKMTFQRLNKISHPWRFDVNAAFLVLS